MLDIHMGREMEEIWTSLRAEVDAGTASADTKRQFKRLQKGLALLSENPRHPGLHSHKVSAMTKRAGFEVWESYLQNNSPGAGRLFWAYGPDKNSITVYAAEPHPNDKGAYQRIKL